MYCCRVQTYDGIKPLQRSGGEVLLYTVQHGHWYVRCAAETRGRTAYCLTQTITQLATSLGVGAVAHLGATFAAHRAG